MKQAYYPEYELRDPPAFMEGIRQTENYAGNRIDTEWENESTRTRGSVPLTIGVAGDPKIIDLTAKADKSKRYKIREPQKVYALVLHQMACCFNVGNPLTRYPKKMASHFVILPKGQILQLHPIQALTAASNGFNHGSVAVEFAGNFPNSNGRWWIDQKDINAIREKLRNQNVPAPQIESRVRAYIKANQNQVTPEQIAAGRYLVRYLMRVMAPGKGLTHILAHRQSYSSRENDPGPDIWYHVGQWAVDNFGLKDGGPGFKVDSGNPIPDLWRTWGKRAKQRELFDGATEMEIGGQALPANTPQGPFGTLRLATSRGTFSYRFTPEDVLWTARFIVGEAGGKNTIENRAVIWAMFNRFAFFTHRVYPTFNAFLRRYSTPLQPVLQSSGAAKRHMNDLNFIRTGGYYPGTNIPRGQLARYLQLQRTAWSQLPKSARTLAENALKGLVPNPGIGNASEFDDTAVYFRDRYGRRPTQAEWLRFTQTYPKLARKNLTWVGPVPGLTQYRINSFFIDNRVKNLPPNAVRVI
jgi:N-acetylmuramoyl-L-alanine amidase-like protein